MLVAAEERVGRHSQCSNDYMAMGNFSETRRCYEFIAAQMKAFGENDIRNGRNR